MSFLPFCISYVMWAVWHLVKGYIPLPDVPLSFAVNTAAKAVIWLGPWICALATQNGKWLIKPKNIFSASFPWLPTFVGLCLTVAFLHTAHIILTGIGTFGIFQPIHLLMALSAAVIEELTFRGFLFNRQVAVLDRKWAVLVNGLLFAIYHFPEFLYGQNMAAFFGFRFWMITVMGCLLSASFWKWKNLGMPMVIHFVWNMLCYWFDLT